MSQQVASLPGTKHKVIGLVSGGKDSTFNLLHCVANGHEIVAIATLTPEAGVDELDSHLYQSVGTSVLPHLARAMSLPLFTRVIKGKAVARGAEYGDRTRGGEGSGQAGDETEDLTMLLRQVLEAHPDATAVASGAILSNYQRLRIEHVCGRLGLVSLSYLWQQPQLHLLDRMLACGMEVVLVKVAGVGLGVDLVGKTIKEVRPLLAKLEKQYGSHPAGEGGEYETLTLSTPLFSHRLSFTKTKVIVTDPEPYPVAYLQVEDAELVEKEGWVRPSIDGLRETLGLKGSTDGLDEQGREVLEELGAVQRRPNKKILEQFADLCIRKDEPEEILRFAKRGRWFVASINGRTKAGETVGEELRHCFDTISNTLSAEGLSLPLHATHITLLLSSMSLFAPANEVYKTYFGTSPPSRATVAVPLPESGRVRLEVLGFDDRPNVSDSSDLSSSEERNAKNEEGLIGGRQALHVQGLSYWAPANIGPYSQAIIVNSRVHLAGQIPLLPASLTLPPNPAAPSSPYPLQAMLALQHVRRILEVLRSPMSTGGGWSGWGEGCVGWWALPDSDEGMGGEGAEVVRAAWRIWAGENAFGQAPVVFVRARDLPRGALVEFQVNLHTGRQGVPDTSASGSSVTRQMQADAVSGSGDNSDDDDEELRPLYASGGDEAIWWEMCVSSGRAQYGIRTILFFAYASISKGLETLTGETSLTSVLKRAVSVKVYHLPSVSTISLQALSYNLWPTEGKVNSQRPCWTFVPVFDISGRRGRQAAVAIEMMGV